MNFQWILLALFLVAIIAGLARARKKSMLKNALRFGSVIVAYLITFILQICGVFQGAVSAIVNMTGLVASIPVLAPAKDFINAAISTFVSPIFFIIVFFVFMFIIRIVINIVLNSIESKEKENTTPSVEENVTPEAEKQVENNQIENQENTDDSLKTEENIEQSSENTDSITVNATDDAVLEKERTTEIKDEAKEPRKSKLDEILYPECTWKRVVSLVSGAISGLLILAILLMPVFYIFSVVNTTTDAIEASDSSDSKIYKLVDTVDKHINEPYKKSFVIKFYDAVGISDLLNYTTKSGGKIVTSDGSKIYADDVIKNILSHGVSAISQITSADSECNTVKNDVNSILTDPVISSIISDIIMTAIDNAETETPAEDDIIGEILYNFVDYYKNADEPTIKADLAVVGETVEVLAKEKVLVKIISGKAEIAVLLEDKESLGDVVEAISYLSAFGPTIESAFEAGIEILGETLNIPENNQEVYDNFIDNLLVRMKRSNSNTKFDSATLNKIRGYIYTCEARGLNVSSSNGIAGHKEFTDYVNHWKQIQSAFAIASEDKSYGYFSIEISGKLYIYDDSKPEAKKFVIHSEENAELYKGKISPVTGLINALTSASTTKQPTEDDLHLILNAYIKSSSDGASRDLAIKMLDRDSYTSEAATLEKMRDATDFTNWTADEKLRDSRICVEIITDLLTLMDSMDTTESDDGKDSAMEMLDQFDLLGKTMDDMKQTSCINRLPALLIEGIVKNEVFDDFMKPSTAFQINDIVENNNKTYSHSMKQIKDILDLTINAFGGEK